MKERIRGRQLLVSLPPTVSRREIQNTLQRAKKQTLEKYRNLDGKSGFRFNRSRINVYVDRKTYPGSYVISSYDIIAEVEMDVDYGKVDNDGTLETYNEYLRELIPYEMQIFKRKTIGNVPGDLAPLMWLAAGFFFGRNAKK